MNKLKNRDEMLEEVKRHGGALEFASDELKGDREITLVPYQEIGNQ